MPTGRPVSVVRLGFLSGGWTFPGATGGTWPEARPVNNRARANARRRPQAGRSNKGGSSPPHGARSLAWDRDLLASGCESGRRAALGRPGASRRDQLADPVPGVDARWPIVLPCPSVAQSGIRSISPRGPTAFGPEDTATTPIDGPPSAPGRDGTDERRHPPPADLKGPTRPGLIELRADPEGGRGGLRRRVHLLIV